MKITHPTKQQVFNSLREMGCCWLGGSGCECYSRQLCQCFSEEEARLTKSEPSAAEIKQAQEDNERVWHEIWDLI